MSEQHKRTMEAANAAIVRGDHEGFLQHCTEDIVWEAVGDMTLHGKAAVREWMKTAYAEPPEFTIDHMLTDGDFLVALGSIMAEDDQQRRVRHAVSDVWRFRDGKMASLRAFVIPSGD